MAKRIQSLASEFLDRDRPGDFNQAMMELGATVCVPSGQPQCGVCPLSGVCVARKEEAAFRESGGDVSAPDAPLATRFPQKVEKKGPRDETGEGVRAHSMNTVQRSTPQKRTISIHSII